MVLDRVSGLVRRDRQCRDARNRVDRLRQPDHLRPRVVVIAEFAADLFDPDATHVVRVEDGLRHPAARQVSRVADPAPLRVGALQRPLDEKGEQKDGTDDQVESHGA